MITVATTDIQYMPTATAVPIAATAQMLAAVVSPKTSPSLRKIVPAPRKPTPVTI